MEADGVAGANGRVTDLRLRGSLNSTGHLAIEAEVAF